MLVDMHVKTEASEGVSIKLDDAIKAAKEANLDGIAICEKLSSAGVKDAIKKVKKAGLAPFVGVEIHTNSGVLLCFPPKVDAFLTKETWSELTEFTKPDAKDVIELVESLGGAVIASRTYDGEITPSMGDDIFEIEGLAAVEVFNSNLSDIQSDFSIEAASVLQLKTIGGSDTAKAGAIGKYATLFKEELKSQKDLVDAIKEGEFWAVQVGRIASRKPAPRESRGRDDRGRRDGRRDGGKRRDDRGGNNNRRGRR